MRRFEPPPTPYATGHRGVDLLGAPGNLVLAVADGQVTHVGRLAGRGTVTVRHPGGLRSTYEPVSSALRVGALVRAREPVGRLEAAGHCRPRACLHLGALTGPRQYLDPLTLLVGSRVILLPLKEG